MPGCEEEGKVAPTPRSEGPGQSAPTDLVVSWRHPISAVAIPAIDGPVPEQEILSGIEPATAPLVGYSAPRQTEERCQPRTTECPPTLQDGPFRETRQPGVAAGLGRPLLKAQAESSRRPDAIPDAAMEPGADRAAPIDDSSVGVEGRAAGPSSRASRKTPVETGGCERPERAENHAQPFSAQRERAGTSPAGPGHRKARPLSPFPSPIERMHLTGTLPPEKRGGGPRGPREGPAAQRRSEGEPNPDPELLCFFRERAWQIAVQVPEELSDDHEVVVRYGGQELGIDDTLVGFVRELDDAITITVQGVKEWTWALGESPFLVFKLQRGLRGRCVAAVSLGEFLILTRHGLEPRFDSLEGVSKEKDEVLLEGFTAWRCLISRPQPSLHLVGDRTSVEVPTTGLRFQLVGSEFRDAVCDQGPLFLSGPIRLTVEGDEGWSAVSTVVVVEESRGPGRRWRTWFQPDCLGLTQDLPDALMEREAGRYSIRLYNQDWQLIESMDFRFCSLVNSICSPQCSPVPGPDGHAEAEFRIRHLPQLTLKPNRGEMAGGGTLHRVTASESAVVVPPDPDHDDTRWLIGREGGPYADLGLRVDRVWWALCTSPAEKECWKDRPLSLPQRLFQPASQARIAVRLPSQGWAEKASIKLGEGAFRDIRQTENTRLLGVGLAELSLGIGQEGLGLTGLVVRLHRQGVRTDIQLGEVVPHSEQNQPPEPAPPGPARDPLTPTRALGENLTSGLPAASPEIPGAVALVSSSGAGSAGAGGKLPAAVRLPSPPKSPAARRTKGPSEPKKDLIRRLEERPADFRAVWGELLANSDRDVLLRLLKGCNIPRRSHPTSPPASRDTGWCVQGTGVCFSAGDTQFASDFHEAARCFLDRHVDRLREKHGREKDEVQQLYEMINLVRIGIALLIVINTQLTVVRDRLRQPGRVLRQEEWASIRWVINFCLERLRSTLKATGKGLTTPAVRAFRERGTSGGLEVDLASFLEDAQAALDICGELRAAVEAHIPLRTKQGSTQDARWFEDTLAPARWRRYRGEVDKLLHGISTR